jgi:hypothetical protein
MYRDAPSRTDVAVPEGARAGDPPSPSVPPVLSSNELFAFDPSLPVSVLTAFDLLHLPDPNALAFKSSSSDRLFIPMDSFCENGASHSRQIKLPFAFPAASFRPQISFSSLQQFPFSFSFSVLFFFVTLSLSPFPLFRASSPLFCLSLFLFVSLGFLFVCLPDFPFLFPGVVAVHD